MGYLNMVVVPQSRPSHPFAPAMSAQPVRAGRVRRWLTKTAQESNAVSFNGAARAVAASFVRDVQMKKRHIAQVLAYYDLMGSFEVAYVTLGRRTLTPTCDRQRPLRFDYGFADQQSENRTAVISAGRVGRAAMLTETVPERRARFRCQCVCSDTHNPLLPRVSTSELAGLKEEVDAALRPRQSPMAIT